jgi:3-oxoacyl-[acyl-carrier protein] reductase
MSERIALITGASSGIGRVCAIELAKEGCTAIINYYPVPPCEADANNVVKEIEALGGKAKAIGCDVTKSAEVDAMIDKIVEEFGRIDVLVNNAGITRDGLLVRMSDDDWERVINTNLNSVFYVTRPVAKVMMKQRSGNIVNMASITGVYGNAGQANYASTKAGVIGFTKTVAKELASRGIVANAVAPGFIETPMTEKLDKEKIAANIPLKRLGTPDDIANLVKFLAQPNLYITGQVIGVDGGLVI